MATVIREVAPSRPLDLQDGKLSSSREFIVYDDVTPTNFSRPDQVVNIFGVTAGDTMPTYWEQFPNIPELRAIDYGGLRQEDGNPFLWRITWNYSRVNAPGPGGFLPGQPGYWEYNYSATVEVEDAWRDNPGLVFPDGGVIVNPSAGVGGVSIDSCGEPGSAFRMVQNLDITEVVEGQYTPAASFTFLKKRNNNTFLGASKGRLVYAGIVASSRVDTGIFSITHRMVWDEWFHMRQRVKRSSSGEPYKKTIDGVPTTTDWVAEAVTWYQPFPSLANFDSISSNWP